MTRAQNRSNAAWLRSHFHLLTSYIASSPHRWPHARIVRAQNAILEGDAGWQLAAADVLQTERA